MNSHLIRKIIAWWKSVHPDRKLDRIPAYRQATQALRAAERRGCTQDIAAARKQRSAALHVALAGRGDLKLADRRLV